MMIKKNFSRSHILLRNHHFSLIVAVIWLRTPVPGAWRQAGQVGLGGSRSLRSKVVINKRQDYIYAAKTPKMGSLGRDSINLLASKTPP